MSKYEFNAERCEKAIEDLASILQGIPVTDQETRKRFQYALDGLIINIDGLVIDIEDLRRRAKEEQS
jgi:hypothetical protein